MVEDWALRFPPYACPSDISDRRRNRRVLVSVHGVVVYERCVVLDLVVACEVIETERPNLRK